jgi:hypothetical protein
MYVPPQKRSPQQPRAGFTEENLAASGISRGRERQQLSDDDASSVSRMSTITARTRSSAVHESAAPTLLETASLPGLIFCARDIRQAKENGVVSLEFSCSTTSRSAAEDAVFWKEKLLNEFDGVEAEINAATSNTVVRVSLRHDGHPAQTIVKYLSDNNFFDQEHENKVNYFLNILSEISTECEPESQPADEIVVSEGVCKLRKRQAIISVVARSFCSSTRTTRESKWEGSPEISALWDVLDEQALKCWVLAATRTTKTSAALSRDERYNQVSSIARTLLAVALRRGIGLRSIFSEAVQSTTKLLDSRSAVPTDLMSFRSSIFAKWGQKDRKREETQVLMDHPHGLFDRIDFVFNPRKGKTGIDSQVQCKPPVTQCYPPIYLMC